MHEQIAETLLEKGFKKHKTKDFIAVKKDMVFVVSFQGIKNDIYLWYCISPLCLPNLWINRGFHPAAGRFPEVENTLQQNQNIENQINEVLDNKVLPLFSKCNEMSDLINLYESGNDKAKFSKAFCLFGIGEYKKAQIELMQLKEIFSSKTD